jgi:hypothetical protein
MQDVSISTPSRRGKTPSTGYEGQQQQQPPSLALFDPTVRAAAVAAATGAISATSTPSAAHSTSLAGVPPSSSFLAANTTGDMLSPVSTYGTPSAPSPPAASQTETPVLTFPSPHQQQEAFTARLYQDVVVGGQGGSVARASQQQQQQQQQAAPAAAVPLLRPQSPAHSRAAADTYSDAWIPTPACKQVGAYTAYQYRSCNS